MNRHELFYRISIILFFFLFSIQVGFTQNSSSEEISNSRVENAVDTDRNEISLKVNDANLYKTIDSTHMFLGADEFVIGHIISKNKTYHTKLKYDLLNDKVVIHYDDGHQPISVSLSPEIVDQFRIEDRELIKLPESQNLKSYYENGFFERIYGGADFSFFIKHRKKLKKNKDRTNVIYSFWEESIFLFEHKDQFYRIGNKRDIIKIVPHLKKEIEHFFGRFKRIDQTSLTRLFIQLDSIESKKLSISHQ